MYFTLNLFVWDPTEPIATRPLFTQRSTGYKLFYTCDGNKNVSELVHFEARNGIAARYDYAPFGAVTRAISASTITDNTFTTDNPFRFSSEYHDDTLGLVYYNYRHYNPIDGRWCGRDIKGEEATKNLFNAMMNRPLNVVDLRGNDIYLMTGNDSDNPLNNMLHQAVCVDVWGEDCKQIGVLCFSFAQVGWRWNSGSCKWLGYENSWTLMVFFMFGEVYRDSVVETATIVALKKRRNKKIVNSLKKWKKNVGRQIFILYFAIIVVIFRKGLLKMHQAKRRIFQNEVIRNVSVCGDRVGWCFVL